MSKSARTSHPHTRKPGKRVTTSPAAAPNANIRPLGHPKVIGGIDFGPAIAAVRDLIVWAFDLAERDVAGRPEARRRVRTARRFVLARLYGKPWRAMPVEDVLFTVVVLARIFEADLHMPMSNVVGLVAHQLGLHAEMTAFMDRAPSAVCRPQDSPLAPPRPCRTAVEVAEMLAGLRASSAACRPQDLPLAPLRPRPAAVTVPAALADVCDACGRPASRIRIAA